MCRFSPGSPLHSPSMTTAEFWSSRGCHCGPGGSPASDGAVQLPTHRAIHCQESDRAHGGGQRLLDDRHSGPVPGCGGDPHILEAAPGGAGLWEGKFESEKGRRDIVVSTYLLLRGRGIPSEQLWVTCGVCYELAGRLEIARWRCFLPGRKNMLLSLEINKRTHRR